MQFQHLIEINDPRNPMITPMTREQLWRGLVLRAETPKIFVPWLDQCNLLDRSGAVLSRELHYGTVVVRDHVTFLPQQQVRYEVPEQKDIPASSLVMTIEEPVAGSLFVRFAYDDGRSDAEDMDAFYSEFRRSAYQESDIDTIRVIRELVVQGRLDAPN